MLRVGMPIGADRLTYDAPMYVLAEHDKYHGWMRPQQMVWEILRNNAVVAALSLCTMISQLLEFVVLLSCAAKATFGLGLKAGGKSRSTFSQFNAKKGYEVSSLAASLVPQKSRLLIIYSYFSHLEKLIGWKSMERFFGCVHDWLFKTIDHRVRATVRNPTLQYHSTTLNVITIHHTKNTITCNRNAT